MTRRRALVAAALLLVVALTSSCSWVSGWFGSDDDIKAESVSVFDAEIGDCFTAQPEVKAELSDLSRVECSVEHQQELYAIASYDKSNGGDDYPGDAALTTFAKGTCAEKFADYVGIAYPDSGLWMTYLLPSARSWQQGKDRSVLCFVTTTTGGTLAESVRGTKQ